MSADTLHHDSLVETARLELDRAHRAVLAVQAGEIRRGLELAVAALREACSDGTPDAAPSRDTLLALIARLEKGQAEIDSGLLTEAANLIESARKELNL